MAVVGDNPVPAVHGAVVEVEEALRLAIAHHVVGLGISARDHPLLRRRFALPLRQWPLAVSDPIRVDRRIQIIPEAGARPCDRSLVEPVLVGAGLQVSGVGVQNRPVHQPEIDHLLHDPIEDRLRRRRFCDSVEASNTGSLNFSRRNQR